MPHLSNPITVRSITTGYSDSEDRLWARLVLDNGEEARLWLTRRLTLRLCKGVVDLLIDRRAKESNLDIDELKNSIAKARLGAELDQAQSRLGETPAPPPPEPNTPVATGICHSIDITPTKGDWRFVFKAANTPGYLLPINQEGVVRLVAGLLKQSEANGWDVPASVHQNLFIEKESLDPRKNTKNGDNSGSGSDSKPAPDDDGDGDSGSGGGSGG